MKHTIFIALIIGLICPLANAQKSKLITGNGNVVPVAIPEITEFNRLVIYGIPGGKGTIKVICGSAKPAVRIESDQNLVSYFDVQQDGPELTIALPKNRNNRLWIEDTHTNITVEVTTLEALDLSSNLNCVVSGLNNQNFTLNKSTNGDVELLGKVENLMINKTGNGNISAQNLDVKSSDISSMGNGDVTVRVSQQLTTNRSGNGNITNIGTAIADRKTEMGNGETLDQRNRAALDEKGEPIQYVEVVLLNATQRSRHFTIIGSASRRFSYGIEIRKGQKVTENLPVGTQIKNKLGQTIYTISAEDAGKKIKL
jgi:hypothetical protein